MTGHPRDQLPRYGTLWLLVAFAAAVAPHMSRLPFWVSLGAVLAAGYRIQIYRGAWGYPGRWLKVALLLLCVGGLFAHYGRLYGLEPMVALLVSAYALKLLEMRRRRDALVVIYLGFFVAVSQCLFEQGLATAFYTFASVVAVAAGLAGIHQTDLHHHYWRPVRTALGLFALAVPLTVLMFLILPRIEPLWSVPLERGAGRTGMSETMAPGDITRLGRSADVAFRVEFDGAAPPSRALYWRGLTLSRFDGRAWTRREAWESGRDWVQWYGETPTDWAESLWRGAGPLAYRVMLEPTHYNWLYAIAVPQPETPEIGVTRNYSLVRKEPVTSKFSYRVRSWPAGGRAEANLSALGRRLYTVIPEGFNPRTQTVARRWAGEASDRRVLVGRVLGLFRADFTYTLSPPALGRHTVDEFLWQTRAGFCEHFASAFAFFMRAAGVPARVVIGYQGGELNPDEGYLTVRQYDAHAWAEVWFDDEGWVRVDPTAAVAPERVERSIVDILGNEDSLLSDSPLSLARFRGINWLNALRLRLDYLDYLWTKWVLNYDDKQSDLLGDLLGRVQPWRLALFFLIGGAVALVPALWFLFGFGRQTLADRRDRLFDRFCRRLAKAGIKRRRGEGPRSFGQRVIRQSPVSASEVRAIVDAYERLRYGGDEAVYTELRRRVRRFRPGQKGER